jgi:hypothetical protein
MTDRIWVGGNSNGSVYDPNNWSPPAAPQPGDRLNIVDGSASMKGGNLAGDALEMGYSGGPSPGLPSSVAPVLNISGGASVSATALAVYVDDFPTINVSGRNTVNLAVSAPPLLGKSLGLTVNIDHGSMSGSIQSYHAQITIAGPGNFENVDSSLQIGNITIDSDMIGTGSTSLAFAHLELGGRVSSGQTFSLTTPGSSVTIDDPHKFHGTIVEAPNGFFASDRVNLLGLHADSYSLANDMLTLYAGHKVVDRLALQTTPAATTAIGQGASGVVIGLDGQLPAGVTSLPMHSGCT